MQELNFPSDHYSHDTTVEWQYWWGKLSNETFFHFANFRFKFGGFRGRAVHSSLHDGETQYFEETCNDYGEMASSSGFLAKGNRFHLSNKTMGLHMFPKSKPVIHDVGKIRNYYSIPSLEAEGYLYPDKKVTADVWMDHEFSDFDMSAHNWDWVAVKLDIGMNIVVYKAKEREFCSVMYGDKTGSSKFILDGKHLYIYGLASYFIMEPTVEEKIFHPKFGPPYSEQPFRVMGKGEFVGHGMREKTYGDGGKVNGN